MRIDDLKNTVDTELQTLTFNNAMKQYVKKHKKIKDKPILQKYAAVATILIILCGTMGFAGYHLLSKINVNDTTLPELDAMKVTAFTPFSSKLNEFGQIEESFTDYRAMISKLGIPLLNSDLSENNPYMLGTIKTDNKNFAIITVQNYILGDTSNYVFLPDIGRYQFSHGKEYYLPVSLSIDIILSEDQLTNGWDTDYLGMYEYVESYTSAQGYKVNIVQDTIDDKDIENAMDYISEKNAVFVADGIRYTIKGRTSLENIKKIVDSMKF